MVAKRDRAKTDTERTKRWIASRKCRPRKWRVVIPAISKGDAEYMVEILHSQSWAFMRLARVSEERE